MPLTGGSTILVPVDVSSDERPAKDLLTVSDAVDLVLLGYYRVPDQAPPAQLKADHGDDAERRLTELAATIDRDLTRRVAFTHDRDETIDRAAEEYDCDAILLPGSHTATERVFVPLRGDDNLDRVLSLVGDLLRRKGATATLFHATTADEQEYGRSLLDDAAGRLVEAGIDRARIDTRLATTDDPGTAIIELAHEFDLLVVGETEPSLTDRILGRVSTRIADEVDRPTFVVRDV
jgi:nucleotide-binding universal stress UspA family protein